MVVNMGRRAALMCLLSCGAVVSSRPLVPSPLPPKAVLQCYHAGKAALKYKALFVRIDLA